MHEGNSELFNSYTDEEKKISINIDVTNEKVKSFTVEPTTIQNVTNFVKHWHYSKNVNGLRSRNIFQLKSNDSMIGCIVYGGLAMANNWKKYAEEEKYVIELKRLCCIDKTPKNTESYFIAKTIKWLKANTDYKIIVSHADPFFGHEGIIYQASNFEHIGLTAKCRVIKYQGKLYHDKTIRNYYTNSNGEKRVKPYAQKIKDALENGEAQYIDVPGKHIYIYRLKK